MRTNGHVFLHRPRVALGLGLSAFVPDRAHPGGRQATSALEPANRPNPSTRFEGKALYLRYNQGPMRLWTTIACLFCITGSLWSGTGENSKGNLPQVLTPRRMTRRVPLAEGNDIQFRRLGASLSQTRGAATFTLAIIGEPKILESTVQDEASRIAGEALTNAFRHASASKIETEVTYDSSALRIRVRDDGVGIDKALLANGHPEHWV